jgi:hypothetical protein
MSQTDGRVCFKKPLLMLAGVHVGRRFQMDHALVTGAGSRKGFGLSFHLVAALLGVILFAVEAKPAVAESEFVGFTYVVAQSDVIVVASLTDVTREKFAKSSEATLNVSKVLKGNLEVGKRRVRSAETSYPGTGEFIAFFDKAGAWNFTAVPLSKSTVASDVLTIHPANLESFVNGVIPGLITLRQLENYLKTGSLRYSFRGPIWFPKPGQASWKASTLRIEWTYDAVSNSSHLSGLGKLAGFAFVEPAVGILSDRRDSTSVEPAPVDFAYSRGMDRPLEMLGKVDGLDVQSGAMITRFAVTAPDVLTEATLRDYLANPDRGHCYYTYRLHCSPTEKQTKIPDLLLSRHKDYSIGYLEGWGEGTLPIAHLEFNGPLSFMSTSHASVPGYIQALFAQDWVLRLVLQTKTGEYLILAFDNHKPIDAKDSFQWAMQDPLLYRLYRAPLTGSLQIHDGKSLRTIATFTVRLEPVAFANKEWYRPGSAK